MILSTMRAADQGANGQLFEGIGVKDRQLNLRSFANVGLSNSVPAALTFLEASPEGFPYKLCYQFGIEPYRLYPNITLTAAEVTEIRSNIGSPSSDHSWSL